MCSKARKRPELQAYVICHHSLIKILDTHELNKQVEQLRQRNTNPPIPRRSKRGQTRVHSQAISQETKGESSQPEVERHEEVPIKMPKVEICEGRTISQRSQQRIVVEEEETKPKISKTKRKNIKLEQRMRKLRHRLGFKAKYLTLLLLTN